MKRLIIPITTGILLAITNHLIGWTYEDVGYWVFTIAAIIYIPVSQAIHNDLMKRK